MDSRGMLAIGLGIGIGLWACASAAGEPLRLGVIGGVARLSVADPEGPTATAAAPDLAVVAILGWGRDTRLRLAAGRQTVTLAASTVDIGQRVERTSASLSYQERWRLSYRWKPWLGIGLGYAREDETLRHTIDRDGFLATAYPDRTVGVFDAVLTADSEWRWTHGWKIGVALRYDAPFAPHAATVLAAGALLTHRLR